MKKQLRKEIINKRMEMSGPLVEEKSKQILDIIKTIDLNKYSTILIFMDFRNEVQTRPIIEFLISKKKKILLPKIDNPSHTMTLHALSNLKDLKRSSFGILEPTSLVKISEEAIDLIFAPGLAFDLKGMRLGYGGGFYDQLLLKIKPSTPVIALAFDFQIVDQVPHDHKDIPINGIITEKKFYNFNVDFNQ
jgi:5-formyltetrahydrofolate cyclo-ligase